MFMLPDLMISGADEIPLAFDAALADSGTPSGLDTATVLPRVGQRPSLRGAEHERLVTWLIRQEQGICTSVLTEGPSHRPLLAPPFWPLNPCFNADCRPSIVRVTSIMQQENLHIDPSR
ncbi:hypothetical protein LIA77_04078 [Sarocladium implicatum]|nr:hypothetical protein LIA77_04078 [Sarocladium implicatum]